MADNAAYPPSRTLPAAIARLAKTEDWSQISAAANASPNHVSSDERWTRKAKEANPNVDDDQAYRLGQLMKKAHFVKMGKLSVQARRLAREAAASGLDDDEPPLEVITREDLDPGIRFEDPEVDALSVIVDRLAALEAETDSSTVTRVIRYLRDRYGADG